MTTLLALRTFLDDYLEVAKMNDYGPIGLQVEGTDSIKKLGFAVSANLETFRKAHDNGCQAIITHHGLLWKNDWPFPLTGVIGKRIGYLFKHDLSLLSYHLPLDCHPVVGNNAQLLSILGARMTTPFGQCELGHWGWSGEFIHPIKLDLILTTLQQQFGTTGTLYPFGPTQIKTVCAITGGGADYLNQAIALHADLFITGELKEPIQELAREAGINVIAPGHYNTETLGVKALMDVVARDLVVEAVFLDVPNNQ